MEAGMRDVLAVAGMFARPATSCGSYDDDEAVNSQLSSCLLLFLSLAPLGLSRSTSHTLAILIIVIHPPTYSLLGLGPSPISRNWSIKLPGNHAMIRTTQAAAPA